MKCIIALIGKSGSGKSTLAEALSARYGLKIVRSYTDRPCRGSSDRDHIFLSPSKYDSIPTNQKVAETTFANHRYCATIDQVESCDIYIIDPTGYAELLRRYNGTKQIVPVYLDVPEDIRLQRMLKRGDSEDQALKRIYHDASAFQSVYDIPGIIIIDGTQPLTEVYEQTKEKSDRRASYLRH